MGAPKVELFVNGSIYAGWEEVSVKQSIKAVSSAFDLTVTDDFSKGWPIGEGDECELKIEGQSVVSGFIDDLEFSEDASSSRIRVAGRDMAADIVDCSNASGLNHFNQPISLMHLAKILCDPYGVTVSTDVTITQLLTATDIKESESVFQVLDRKAKICGVLITSDGNGGVLFTRAGKTNAGFKLVYGQNIASYSAKYSWKERYSEYIVKADLGLDAAAPELSTPLSSKAVDSEITRFRRLTILEEPQSIDLSASARANWEQSTRAGKSETLQIQIIGFTKPDGTLWKTNQLIPVVIPKIGLNESLLITDVTFNYGKSGSITNLSLTRKDAFNVLPPNPQGLWYQAAHEAKA